MNAKRFSPSKEIGAVVQSIIERNGGFKHKILAYEPEDEKKLNQIVDSHHTTRHAVLRWARKQRGVVLYHRRDKNGDVPGTTNYCANCGTHLRKLDGLIKVVAFCPGCGRRV